MYDFLFSEEIFLESKAKMKRLYSLNNVAIIQMKSLQMRIKNNAQVLAAAKEKLFNQFKNMF